MWRVLQPRQSVDPHLAPTPLPVNGGRGFCVLPTYSAQAYRPDPSHDGYGGPMRCPKGYRLTHGIHSHTVYTHTRYTLTHGIQRVTHYAII